MRLYVLASSAFGIVALMMAVGIGRDARCDEISDARRAFVSGMKHFDLGEYGPALTDFKNGYRAKEDPVFLYNIAQCYRMMKQNSDAIRYYRLYLSRAPDASNRGEIEARIVKLQEAADSQSAEASTPAPATTSPRPSVTPVVPMTTATASTPLPAKSTPAYKKWWLWTIVGVVAVGAGVGLGVGLTHGSTSSGTMFPTASF